MKDYYKTLGVQKSVSDDELKKAYRKLAHQYHPDKAHGDEKKFKEINEAYQVLSDKKKRDQYDRFGTADFSGFSGGGFPGGGGAAPGWDWSSVGGFPHGQAYGDVGDLSDLFESFFEGLGVKSRRPTYRRGSDLETIQDITLEEAFRGVAKEIAVGTFVVCGRCAGKGGDIAAGFKPCAACNGQGEVKEERRTFFGSFAQVKTCEVCHGFGQVPHKVCAACKGSGRAEGERAAHVEILPGVHDNQIIKVKGAGEAGERGTAVGDLYVRVKVKPHQVFERDGDDLIVSRELNALDLLLGRKAEIPTISGGKIRVDIPAHFNLKDSLRIPGEGMPRFGAFGRGDLLVDFTIRAPKKLDPKVKKILEELEGKE